MLNSLLASGGWAHAVMPRVVRATFTEPTSLFDDYRPLAGYHRKETLARGPKAKEIKYDVLRKSQCGLRRSVQQKSRTFILIG
jgi:hypothetical protein